MGAWVILFTSFCGMLFVGSMVFSSGVLMAAMLEEIDNDLTRTSWITSLFAALVCVSGPLVGFVTNKFDCRVSAIVGGLLCVVGLTAAHFTNDVYLLIPTYSILTGTCVGFIMSTSFVVTGYYFEEFRPFASGITASGTGVGMFIGPPVFRLLIDVYTLKGYGLYSGGIVSLVNPLTAELVSLEHLASGVGLLAFIAGCGSLAGPPIAGMIVDNGGSYTHSYIYAGAMLLLGSFVAAPIALRRKSSSDNSKDDMEINIDVHAELEPLKSRDDVLISNDNTVL